jgi:hypothetical protein
MVDRQSFSQASSDVGGADVHQRGGDDVLFQPHPKVRRERVPAKLDPRPGQDQKITLFDELFSLVPLGEIIQHVRADQPPDFRPSGSAKLADGINGVAGAGAFQFDVARNKMDRTFVLKYAGKFYHGKTEFIRGEICRPRFVRGLGTGNDDDLVEAPIFRRGPGAL